MLKWSIENPLEVDEVHYFVLDTESGLYVLKRFGGIEISMFTHNPKAGWSALKAVTEEMIFMLGQY